jgi:hypothetical protein
MDRSGSTVTDRGDGRPAAGRRRLAVLAAVVAVLCAQGVYSFVVTPEPYPTVRMPGFGGGPTADGLFATTEVEITIGYADGSTVRPHVDELMAGIRDTARRKSLDSAFRPVDGAAGRAIDDPEVVAWLRAQAERLGDGDVPRFVEMCWRDGAVDARTGRYVDQEPCDVTRIEL